jgi:hypothetical protein
MSWLWRWWGVATCKMSTAFLPLKPLGYVWFEVKQECIGISMSKWMGIFFFFVWLDERDGPVFFSGRWLIRCIGWTLFCLLEETRYICCCANLFVTRLWDTPFCIWFQQYKFHKVMFSNILNQIAFWKIGTGLKHLRHHGGKHICQSQINEHLYRVVHRQCKLEKKCNFNTYNTTSIICVDNDIHNFALYQCKKVNEQSRWFYVIPSCPLQFPRSFCSCLNVQVAILAVASKMRPEYH